MAGMREGCGRASNGRASIVFTVNFGAAGFHSAQKNLCWLHMPKLSIRDLDLAHKRVLIRVDFNVPLKDGVITDDTRIRETLPTIEYALRHKAKVILCSHLGRPKGKPVESMSLKPLVARLRTLLDHVLNQGENVAFSPDCVGEIAQEMSTQLESGQTLLLENLRFHAEEEANDPAFAKQLAALCDIYVNDAFGSAHRAHASTEGITHYVKQSAAGFLMEKELNFLGKVLTEPDRPFVAIIGGSKISGKIDVIDNLLDKADTLLIGGGMAYTFLYAQGQTTGKSLVEMDKIDIAKAALAKAKKKGVKLLLPVDHVLADKFDGSGEDADLFRRRAFPRGVDGARHRRGDDRPLRQGDRRRAHDPMEWPDGRLRAGCICRRNQRHRHAGGGE